METEAFFFYMNEKLKMLNMDINKQKSDKFLKYMKLLIEWNEKVNLTAITDPAEIILKHFVDSLTINKYISKNSKMIDVGTGAGFPGIPIAIYREDVEVLLLDSLNKRINFLNEVVNEIQLKNVATVHSRAEDYGQNNQAREVLDIATSRAVAPLNVLAEYLLPFVKVGGICLCMKGPGLKEELDNATKSINAMGGIVEKIEEIELENMERNILIIRKQRNTPNIYPRKAGTPSKKPIEG